MPKLKSKYRTAANPAAPYTNDHRPHLTTEIAANRWHCHKETVRRALRERRIASIVIGRRRLIPAEEVERVERECRITQIA